MGATVTIFKPSGIKRRLTKKQKAFKGLVLNAPIMTPEEVKTYEKRFLWIKKITD